jgi:hypothetical protein
VRFLRYSVFACLLVLGLFLAVEFAIPLPPAGNQFPDTLPGSTGKAIETLNSLTGLFVTIALAVFGGIGFFIRSFLKSEIPLESEEGLQLGISGASALLSIFAGHLVYWNVVRSLANNFLEFDSVAIEVPVAIQYLSLVVGVVFLFAAAFRAAVRVRGRKPATVPLDPFVPD